MQFYIYRMKAIRFHLQQNLFQSASSCGVVLVPVSAVRRTDILYTFQPTMVRKSVHERQTSVSPNPDSTYLRGNKSPYLRNVSCIC